MAERKELSKAWLHFPEKDDNTSSCIVCKVIVSRMNGNTSDMLNHLSTQHAPKLKD